MSPTTAKEPRSVLLQPAFAASTTSFDDVERLQVSNKRKKSFSHKLRYFFSSLANPRSKRERNFNERSSSLTPASVPLLKNSRRQSIDELWSICCRIALNEPIYNAEISNVENVFHRQRLRIMLKKLDNTIHELQLPPPVSGAILTGSGGVAGESLRDFVSQLPPKCRKISVKADPSGLVARLLPQNCISREARYVGSAFWLWLCAIDDLTEELQGVEYEEALEDVRNGFKGTVNELSPSDVGIASKAFYDLVNQTCIYPLHNDDQEDPKELIWRDSFLDSVREILRAFDAERPLLRTKVKGNNIGLQDWMKVRVVTISARPFMILARASLGLTTTLSSSGYPLEESPENTDLFTPQGLHEKSGPVLSCTSGSTVGAHTEIYDTLEKIEIITQCIMGLQNDILGWEKDHVEGNPLNAIEILIDQGESHLVAMSTVIAVHNNLVDRVVKFATILINAEKQIHEKEVMVVNLRPKTAPNNKASLAPTFSSSFETASLYSADCSDASTVGLASQLGNVKGYVEMLLGFSNGMAAWSSSCKRYVAA